MNCREYKNWIENQDSIDDAVEKEASRHMAVCENCRRLFDLDAILEEHIRVGISEMVVPPASLRSRMETLVPSEEKSGFRFWRVKWIPPVIAAAALMLLYIINPFSGGLESITEIGNHAVENHMRADMTMAFGGRNLDAARDYIREHLGFTISPPELERLGFTIIGGRKCTLGEKNAALFMCEKDGKRISLFVIRTNDLSFNLDEDKTYAIYEKACDITLWRQENLVYALVTPKDTAG